MKPGDIYYHGSPEDRTHVIYEIIEVYNTIQPGGFIPVVVFVHDSNLPDFRPGDICAWNWTPKPEIFGEKLE